jgi:DNA-binding HxlR family transcriptional regulator
MTDIKKRSSCPISSSLDIFGDKWSLLIIRDIIFQSQCTYGDFQKSDEKIASNILASKLQILEEAGIIIKSEHPESKAKVLYKLTTKGIELVPVILEISIWGGKYFELEEKHKVFQRMIKKDKKGLVKIVSNKLKKLI